MKKSKQILVFLLYTLIIGLVVLLRSHTLIILLIAIAGGAFLIYLLQDEVAENGENGKTEVTDTKPGDNVVSSTRGAINISKDRYIEIMEPYNLTNRELELGFLIASGFSNAKIAEELYISESTVKKHASHIYEKVGVAGRKEFKTLTLS